MEAIQTLARGALPLTEEEWFAEILRDRNEHLRWVFTQLASERLAFAGTEIERCGSHFQKVCEEDPLPLIEEIEANADLFAHSTRQQIKVQEHTETIMLRRPAQETSPLKSNVNVQDTLHTTLYLRFPRLAGWMEQFAREIGKGSLGMAMIVRLKPGQVVHPHYDRGLYYAARDRYHLVLRSEGSEMQCAGQTQVWRPGEVWWFNNKLRHSARNPGANWRVHVIFDVLPARNQAMSERMRDWAYRGLVE